MCNKNDCCNHTHHAIIFLFILSILLLLNSPNLNFFFHKLASSGPSLTIKGGGGGNGDGDGDGGFPSPPCVTTSSTNKMVMAFLYGSLFTLVLMIVSKHNNEHHQPARGAQFAAGPSRSIYTSPAEDHNSGAERGGVGYALLRTFPTFAYSISRPPKMGKGSPICVVCQFKFRDQELVRWLPECDHLFHISCIDEWLGTHTTCPCCRADLGIATHGSISNGLITAPNEIHDYFNDYYYAF